MYEHTSITLPENLLKLYIADVFIETGSYKGGATEQALKTGFNEIYTIEIQEQYYNKVKEKFKNNSNVNCYLGSSSELLQEILNNISSNKKITFWLDAHYTLKIESVFSKQKNKYPLLSELDIIKKLTKKDHTILIDDVRCFGSLMPCSKQRVEEAIKSINSKYSINYVDSKRFKKDILVATV
ncbi:MAG: hypothetical protein EBU90_12805 [Proteobacteria bacterium]|nr:hypothetical protein [Pseudomonadota bacterium]NBP15387.1 hypothetical protein [bacterium]